FIEHLRISRKTSRSGAGQAVSELAIQKVVEALRGVLTDPAAITTVSDGELAWAEAHAAIESAAEIQNALTLSLERHRMAFERELVTLYSPLASGETRDRANSFSALMLEDLLADASMLVVDLSLWSERLVDRALRVPSMIETTPGRIALARVGGGLILVFLLVILRRRIRSLVSRLMIRVANSGFFRNRAGLLVRLTVLTLAMLPIGVAAAAGYALMALVGFDHAEVRFVEVVFRWLALYFVGRQVVLGLTREESRGRPPLIPVRPETARLLRMTYARLGLVLFLVAIADALSRDWLGTGSLASAVRLVALFWLGLMSLWALFSWRRTLAGTCADATDEGSPAGRLSRWVRDHFAGALLTPLFLVWAAALLFARVGGRLMAEGGLSSYVRAKLLRRMSRRTRVSEESAAPVELPERYVKQFPLYPLLGEEGEVLVPRRAQLDRALAQIERWRQSRVDGSLVVVGEKGIGKTTFLALLDREISKLMVSRHTLNRKYRSEKALVADLAEAFGIEEAQTVGALAAKLRAGGEQVVLLDEAHNVFLRAVDGFRAVEALGRLVNHTSDTIFWVLVFNGHAWDFVSRASRHARVFRQVLRLPAWSQDELEELIARRDDRTGMEIEFEELLLDAEESSTGGFELVASAEGFFRLLWEVSRGNPRVATYLWLRALTPVTEKKLRVGLIREEPASALEKMDPELVFALAAVVQHENLSYDELRQALNVSVDEAAHAGHFLAERGFLEPKHNDPRRMTLAPRFHRQVLRALRENHLLFEEE
ncbi:MAG: AAA family ATPase, partial [Deltaproteobacteria bacterium]|nr:AAA family ATPase [Deltaproteobacteria bacterium]